MPKEHILKDVSYHALPPSLPPSLPLSLSPSQATPANAVALPGTCTSSSPSRPTSASDEKELISTLGVDYLGMCLSSLPPFLSPFFLSPFLTCIFMQPTRMDSDPPSLPPSLPLQTPSWAARSRVLTASRKEEKIQIPSLTHLNPSLPPSLRRHPGQ